MKQQGVVVWAAVVIVFAVVAVVLATTNRTVKAGDDEVPLAPVQRGTWISRSIQRVSCKPATQWS